MTSLKNKSEQKNIVVGHTLKYSKTLFMLTIKRNKLDFDLPSHFDLPSQTLNKSKSHFFYFILYIKSRFFLNLIKFLF